jgi:zinc D-Ala-D-Ala dipeptidase
MRAFLALIFLLLTVPAAPAAAAEPTAPPGAFVSLHDVDPSIVIEMRYLTPHNFIGRRIPGYRENVCLLTRPAA